MDKFPEQFEDVFSVEGPLSAFICAAIEVPPYDEAISTKVTVECVDPETNTLWLAPTKDVNG